MNAPARPATRNPGFDVARAFAILGMILVNFRGKAEVSAQSSELLTWLVDRTEGRAAALFVLLAGVGVILRAERKKVGPDGYDWERRALLKRALILFAVGLLNLHMWQWDILHLYGAYLAIAAFLIRKSDFALVVFGALFVVAGASFRIFFPHEIEGNFWSPHGMVLDMFISGMHPVFPWMAFLIAGMWLGRRNLLDDRIRRMILLGAVLVAVVGEGLDTAARRMVMDDTTAWWLSAWPRPARPVYVLTAGATAIAIVCACVEVTRHRAQSLWVVALTATGQMSFTLYIGHAIAILIPLQHGLLHRSSVGPILIYSFVFYAVAVAGSVWWRRRFEQGPLEGLIRQITGRTTPAPWGGGLLSSKKGAS